MRGFLCVPCLAHDTTEHRSSGDHTAPRCPTISALAFALSNGDFMFLALPGVFVFSVTGFRSHCLLRVGFLMAAGSNLAWIAARKIAEATRGEKLPLELRYDNDFYHFLLIASTFVIYKGFAAGGQRRAP